MKSDEFKKCSKCGEVKPASCFYRHKKGDRSGKLLSRCKGCLVVDQAVRRVGVNESQLSDFEYERTHGKCHICRKKNKDGSKLAIDHDHVTGQIRGLLCAVCNKGIGLFQDCSGLLRAAAEYLNNIYT